MITEDKTITVRYFHSTRPQDAGLAGIPPFSASIYKISDGDTGRDFMFIPHHMGRCNQNGGLNNNTFWLWEWHTLIITHDGGQTWDLWKMKELGGAFDDPASRVADSYIESVTFSDALHGEMTAAYSRRATQDRPQFSLYTTDGGQTWQLSEALAE